MLRSLFANPVEERIQATVWGTWPGDSPMMVSGEPAVNQQTSMQLLTVAGCVRMIADAIATMPVDVFRKSPDGVRAEVRKPAWMLEPTVDLDYTAWCTQILTSLLLHGNAYVHVTRSGTSIVELIVLDPSRVDVRRDGGRKVYLVNGLPFPGELHHLKGMMMPGSDTGLSPLEYARKTIGLGISAVDFGVDSLNNGNNMPGVIESPGTMNPTAMTDMAKAWQRARSRKNRGLPGVLQGGATWKPTGVTNEQAQFLQTQKWNGAQIAANVFLVDPTDLGIPVEGSNHTYANLEQRNLRRLQVTFLPWIIRVEQFLSGLLPMPQYAKVNVDGLLKADSIARWTIYTQAMAINAQAQTLGQPPVMVTPEMRDLEDWGPVDNTFTPPPAPDPAPMPVQQNAQPLHLHLDARQEAPQTHVTVEPARAEVRVEAPKVEVDARSTVNVPEQPVAPINVTVERQSATSRSVERDAAGNITRIVEE